MPVHVDEVRSSVDADPEPGGGGSKDRPWDRQAEFGALRERAAEDSARTKAEAFDD